MTTTEQFNQLKDTDPVQGQVAACLNQAQLLVARKEFGKALHFYNEACRIDPESAEAHLKLGTFYYTADETGMAAHHLIEARKFDPHDVRVLNNLGAVLGRLGRTADAIACFQRVCEVEPENAAAAMNCGRLNMTLGNVAEGERWLTQADQVRPGHSETLRLLTEARLALGQPHMAIRSGEKAIAVEPENPFAYLALGQAYLSARKLDLARAHLTTYLDMHPDDPKALYFLGEVEEKSGRTSEAKALYSKVAGLDIDEEFRSLLKLREALVLPVISNSVSEIDDARTRIADSLSVLIPEPIEDPYLSGGFTNFYLAYQGRDDRDLQQRIAQHYLACCPNLAAAAPHVGAPPRSGKKRIGILSSFLRNHTVGHLNRGLVQHLDRDRFEVVLLRAPILPLADRFATAIASEADRVIDLPDDLFRAREMVFGIQADLIFFPEIGMEDLVYFLAFARSAPVQVMGWGHPVTSGIPNMDAFLSVADMEPEGADAHYSERLIRLSGLSVEMAPPPVPDPARDKASFGMATDAPAYLCAQSLFKIHPDCDVLFKKLVEADPRGQLYFLSIQSASDDMFLTRLTQTVGADMKRVNVLPRAPSADFIALLKCADVLLDIPHWAGGKTSFESLFVGTPVVHWPGEFMRGRHTLAFYKKMGVMDCVVDSADAYVETAVRLVHDRAFSERVRSDIAANAPGLFNDTSAIDEISDVFEHLIDTAR
jgi:protein O-GlcNAc transferase